MKILVFCLPGIGDALMTTPTIKLLKNKYKNSEIDVACMFDGVNYVFKDNSYVNKTYKLSLYKGNKLVGLKQLLSLRKNNYDISILPLPAYRREYHMLQYIVGAKKRIAHNFQKGYWTEFNFLDTDLVLFNEDEHNVINNLKLLKMLDINWEKEIKKEKIKYDFIPNKEDVEFGSRYIQNLKWKKENVVGIHPGSTVSPAAILRRWPIDCYAKLAKYLIKEKKKKILIFAGPDEKEIGKELEKLINDNKDCKLVDKIKFNNAMGILSQINYLICNDNGFGHLAVGLNKRIMTLWASTNDKWSLPYDKDLVTLIRPKNFMPWYRYDLKRKIPKGVRSGMEEIKVENVISALNKFLS